MPQRQDNTGSDQLPNVARQGRPAPHRTKNLMISAAIVAVFLVVAAVLVAINSGSDDNKDQPVAEADTRSMLVRDNSHWVGPAGDGKVTLVEFLDFECEACGAVFPFVEQLRETYSRRVTFVARYFPIPSHFNAERAARAVEAAAGQGAFEAMYQKMYETQPDWAEQHVAKDDVFRGFRTRAGLEHDAMGQRLQRSCHPATDQQRRRRRPNPRGAGNAHVLPQRCQAPTTLR